MKVSVVICALPALLLVAGCGGDKNSGPVCGDNTIEEPEACDDGNTFDGDGCTSDCKVEYPT